MGQGAGQWEQAGVGEGGGAAVRVGLTVREQQDHAADRCFSGRRSDGPSQPCRGLGECALCHAVTVSDAYVYATPVRAVCYVQAGRQQPPSSPLASPGAGAGRALPPPLASPGSPPGVPQAPPPLAPRAKTRQERAVPLCIDKRALRA
ncbi:hypothetical protein JCM13580A_24150 [Streptomyces drozdowiczii]